MQFDIVIVGGGHGGAQCAIALRQRGFEGSLAIVGDDPDFPYERPPLSKDYLAGEKTFDRLLIRPPSFWSDRQVAMLLGRRVVAVDAERHQVTTEAGETISYGSLVWAAGARPRRLTCDGSELDHVHSVRCRADVDRMRDGLRPASRIAVIGGGYIGLEVSAVMTRLGHQVVLLEASDRLLARVAGEGVSHFYEAEHRAQGVDVRTGVTVACILGTSGRASGVLLGTGERIEADMVVVGIGIEAVADPLFEAGAEGDIGIDVDAYCRTSLPDIFAIGDCTAHENAFAGGARIRLESVQNANDQATIVARALTGDPEPYESVPWFWSNQYDLKLQTVGLSQGHDQVVIRGDPADRAFSAVYLRSGRVIALDCINKVKDYVQGRRLVVEGARPDQRQLADPAVPLKALLEA